MCFVFFCTLSAFLLNKHYIYAFVYLIKLVFFTVDNISVMNTR